MRAVRGYEPGLDIIVVNHQTPDDLQRFLDSLDRFPPSHSFSVTISNVEGSAEDRDRALAYVDSKPNVTAIGHAINVGYGIAVNRAVRSGFHDTLAIFNADIGLTAHALDECYRAMWDPDSEARACDILGPRQVDRAGRVTHAGIFGTNSEPTMRGWRSQAPQQYNDVKPAISVSGAAYFIKRDAWDVLSICPTYTAIANGEVGAFLPTPLYYEETWCSYHARAHDLLVMYYGAVEIIHEWHQSVLKTGEAAAMQKMKIAREMFREACDAHGIEHD